MSKEYLKALENMKNGADDWYRSYEMHEDYPVIKSALQRLEAIDNSNPSEALECFDKIYNTINLNWNNDLLRVGIDVRNRSDCNDGKEMANCLDTIKQALLKSQEQEKVLEIIMKNNVDVQYLRYQAVNVRMYNDYVSQLNKVSTINHNSLNEKEFELLKRYCDEEKD